PARAGLRAGGGRARRRRHPAGRLRAAAPLRTAARLRRPRPVGGSAAPLRPPRDHPDVAGRRLAQRRHRRRDLPLRPFPPVTAGKLTPRRDGKYCLTSAVGLRRRCENIYFVVLPWALCLRSPPELVARWRPRIRTRAEPAEPAALRVAPAVAVAWRAAAG